MRWLMRRSIFYLVTAWAAVTLNFLIPRMMPGDPVEAVIGRFNDQGTPLSPAATKALEIAFGLNGNQSLWSQYLTYWDNVFHANFGVSFSYYPTPVSAIIAQALPWTVILVGVSTVLAWALGTLAGIAAGWKRGSRWDAAIPITTFFRGIPQFWIALVAVTVLGVTLGVLPVSGGYTSTLHPGFSGPFLASALQHSLLPALTIIAGSFAGHLLTMRNMMVTSLSEDYVTIAEAKGLSPRRIMFRYAARNALIPSVVGFSLELGLAVSGALVVERVFSYPGVGYVLFQAIGSQDYPLIQAIFLIVTLTVLVANIIADIAYVLVDPRAREGTGQ
jgi:peptide/nickel transport system permease protein